MRSGVKYTIMFGSRAKELREELQQTILMDAKSARELGWLSANMAGVLSVKEEQATLSVPSQPS
ncbi:MAG: hypothetical protein QW291_09375 [Thermofilaceae archaeon]